MVKDATNRKWIVRIAAVAVSLFIIVTWISWKSPQENDSRSVVKSSPGRIPQPLPAGIPRTLNVIRQDDYETLETVSCNSITTTTEPAYKICIHDPTEDRVVSKLLYLNGVWKKSLHEELENSSRTVREYVVCGCWCQHRIIRSVRCSNATSGCGS